jgi:glycosyltransferase involved in cell wall biosynthesis
MKQPKIVFAHDFLNQTGGGERVLETLHEIWPQAEVYTSIYDQAVVGDWLHIPTEKIHTNFIQKLPFSKQLSKHYFFLYPAAFWLQRIRADVVVSVSSFASKFVNTRKAGVHVAYINTPPRFLWGYDTELTRYYHRPFDKYLSPLYQLVVPPLKAALRYFDCRAAQKIDYIIANSKEVQDRIKKHYGRDCVVIYPPVDIERFSQQTTDHRRQTTNDGRRTEGFFLVVSRLGGYKKIDIVVEAFNKLKLPLKIVGDGPQFNYLKSIAKDNIELLGRRSDEEITKLYKSCTALIFPTYEDFGIVPVEAMAAGKTVIAYRRGGALETVVEGVTGEFFDQQTADDIIGVVKKFDARKYNPDSCRKQAKKFSKEEFKRKMKFFVEEVWEKYQK